MSRSSGGGVDGDTGSGPDDALGSFTRDRGLLFATAYRMLGSVADAEDVLQDAWLKWAAADRARVERPTAYLVRTVTNLCLNRLTSARATRETYVGPWLPEPLLTGLASPDAAEHAERADSVSMAMLVVLESLSPLERAVFVLHDAFGYGYAEIAGFLDRTEPAVRQTAHRARGHVQAGRARYATEDVDLAARRELTERFLAASAGGDLNALMELLAPDVTAWSDGGGKVTAATRPLHRPEPVARWVLGVLAKPQVAGITAEPAGINGRPGVLFTFGGRPAGALTFEVAGGLIAELRFQVNPDKLRGLAPPADTLPGA
ncbi:RNA polymerase sigma-70 factor, ECF subfamily [Actinacidiphila yanglinensis]|uniref:RNA polymerase sigma-70 factor, ECF subfamily n=1 Tax=Actinacidiphila yanglinensis TaxID=310779 RepID=A0A1H6BRD8_9ACTN|nr:RNA polymerase sigma-70 factor [Actinacidiphila yanglinensis]SEG63271.1 RNA polymerase sigma-70 factor, ECF subfamily [Actinacidiphila yanglinensis]